MIARRGASPRRDVRRALRAGAHGYVLKDAAGNELVEAVRSLYTGKSYLSPQIAKFHL